jgi:hypothetical protein
MNRTDRQRAKWGQRLGFTATVLLSVGAIALLQLPQLQKLKTPNQTLSTEELQRDMEATRVQLGLMQKIPALGYNNVFADWVFLNFLQYFGDTPARQRTDYTLSPDFFAVIIPQNPRFLATYTFLSTSTAIYAGNPERSVELMDEGLKRLSPETPGAYFVWRNKGIDQLLFLGDGKGAQISFETAAQWADASADPGSQRVADSSRQTAQFLARNPNSKKAQVAAWTMVLGNAPDDRTRRIAIERIQILGGQIIQNQDGSFSVMPPAQD